MRRLSIFHLQAGAYRGTVCAARVQAVKLAACQTSTELKTPWKGVADHQGRRLEIARRGPARA